jgi:hypothetical protein
MRRITAALTIGDGHHVAIGERLSRADETAPRMESRMKRRNNFSK